MRARALSLPLSLSLSLSLWKFISPPRSIPYIILREPAARITRQQLQQSLLRRYAGGSLFDE